MRTCKGKCRLYFKIKTVADYAQGDCWCEDCQCAFSEFAPEAIRCPCCKTKLRWKAVGNNRADNDRILARRQQLAIEIAQRSCILCKSKTTDIGKGRNGKQYPMWRSLATFVKSDRIWRRNTNSWLCARCYEMARHLRMMPKEKMLSHIKQQLAHARKLTKLAIIIDLINDPLGLETESLRESEKAHPTANDTEETDPLKM